MAQEEDCWENDSDLPANLELALVNLEEASALASLMGRKSSSLYLDQTG